jgi:hypothetical protein
MHAATTITQSVHAIVAITLIDSPRSASIRSCGDTFTNTLHVEADEPLEQHTQYALIVTTGVRDALGISVGATEAFRRFRQTAGRQYKQALLRAIHAPVDWVSSRIRSPR